MITLSRTSIRIQFGLVWSGLVLKQAKLTSLMDIHLSPGAREHLRVSSAVWVAEQDGCDI